ncbi:MAG TPA: hypothetical protein P5316_17655 [Phycisphaerae bacterium]|nr:hypothetical protein [Phycisphaerae bacterium]
MADDVSRSSLKPRPVRAEDAVSLHRLLVAELPDIPADFPRWLARWNWQYRDNPFRRDRPAGWVLADGEQVVGHLGAVYVPVGARGRFVIGAIGADYVVSQDALKAGGTFVGLQLAQAFFDGTSGCLRMATTANEKTGAVFGRFGCRPAEWTREFFRAPTGLVQQIRTCRGGANRIVRRLMMGPLGLVGRSVLAAAYGLCGHRPALPIAPGCRLDIGMAPLILEAASLHGRTAPVGFGIARSREYLDWRYVRHPESANIRALLVRRPEGEVIGAAVVFLDRQDGRRIAYLEELTVATGDEAAMHTLVCAALRLAGDHKSHYLVCTAGRSDLRGRFWEYGFESRARSAPALVIGGLEQQAGSASDDSLIAAAVFHHGDMF